MKVLELCLSPGVGGLELYAVRSAKHLRAAGVDCVAVGVPGSLFSQRMQDQRTPVFTLQSRFNVFPLLAVRRLAILIDTEAVDIIHMHWGNDLNLAVLAKRAARRKVKLVYTRQMAITRSKHDVYHRFFYRHIDLYLTITDELAAVAKRYLPLPEDRVQRLYYGVDQPPLMDARRREELRRSLGVSSLADFAIGLVGRIEFGKGQHVLIEAVERLHKEGLPVHATIIGPVMDEEYHQKLQHNVRAAGLQDVVSFYGSHPNPIEIMGAFDTVVLATKKETFGLVLIEAMRSGVVVVGTNAGGVPEIIEHGRNGLLVKPLDAADLADKLRILCRDGKERRRLADNGKAKADHLFATEAHYAQLKSYFTGLCGAQ